MPTKLLLCIYFGWNQVEKFVKLLKLTKRSLKRTTLHWETMDCWSPGIKACFSSRRNFLVVNFKTRTKRPGHIRLLKKDNTWNFIKDSTILSPIKKIISPKINHKIFCNPYIHPQKDMDYQCCVSLRSFGCQNHYTLIKGEGQKRIFF